jgi:hypothetical protein
MRRKKPDLWRGENDRSIMTMLRHIPPFWFILFSHKTWDDAHPSACVLSRPCTSRLLSLLPPAICTERMTNWLCQGDSRKFAGRATHYSKRGIPGMLPKLEEM